MSISHFLSKLLRSFFLQRPANPKLAPPWSLPKVLEALAKPPFEAIAKASLIHLTVKTLFLMVTGPPGRLRFSSALFWISPRSRRTRCTVRAVKWYLDRTKGHRKDDQLYLITREPFSPVSRESISRWILEAIHAGGPPPRGQGQGTRYQKYQRFLGAFQGVGLDDILKAAFWRSPNSFTLFYLRDVSSGKDFAYNLLGHASWSFLCWSSK